MALLCDALCCLVAAVRDHKTAETNLGFGVRVENFGGVRFVGQAFCTETLSLKSGRF